MWVSGQWFSADVVARINGAVEAEPTLSRRALSRQVCEWLEWRDPLGRPRELSARKALVELERRKQIVLPASREIPNFRRDTTARAKAAHGPLEVASIRCGLEELGEVELVPIGEGARAQSALWTRLMAEHHYLGACALRGAQLRYLVRSPRHGVLGGLSFSAATRRLADRDEWIGWSERACFSNLHQVICNSRFLIVAGVEVPNLASHVLGQSLRRLSSDWKERYGYEPVLVETFVDPSKFDGACYRAANWVRVGETVARQGGFQNGKKSTGKKDVYVYALRSDARKVLQREPEDRLRLRGKPAGQSDWVEEEFAGARVFDGRLRRRLHQVARSFAAQPKELVPQTSNGSDLEAQATYRFFMNKRVTMDGLLKGTYEATVGRAHGHAIVLAPQDTTFLNYTAHPPTGVGPIGTKNDKSVGLVVHDTMAFTPRGTPLGLLDVQCWAREPAKEVSKKELKQRPIEEKESFKWLRSYRAVAEAQALCPQTTFVSMGDRESDVFELFDEARRTEHGPKLLVRADRGRSRQAVDGDELEPLWARMVREPLAGRTEVKIPKRDKSPARTAKLEVRHASVLLRAPTTGKPLDPIQLWAVYAREVDHGPEVKEPLDWMLLTTVETRTFEDAVERLDWYTKRWGIEVFHKIIKSGCRVEERMLEDSERIKKALSIDLVVAWRVHQLTMASRETPDVSCAGYFEEIEWQVLHSVVHKTPLPNTPPTLRTAVHMVAKLGGFLGRNRNAEPGIIVIWRGFTRLDGMIIGYRAALRDVARQRTEPP